MKMILTSALLSFLTLTTFAHADGNSFHRVTLNKNLIHFGPTTAENSTFNQVVDHFNRADTRSFAQRYFFDSTYATAGAASPVVFYVCGEGNCEGESAGGFTAVLAKKLGANLVALEHRYYGASQPFEQMTTENLKYLTMEQAIEDLATFQRAFSAQQHLTGKWVAIGGSYPADLAAIYRLKHPELAAGAIASSACAKFSQGSIDSDKVAAQTAGAACVAKYRTNVLLPIQMAMGNASVMSPIKAAFDASDITDDLDFLGTVSGMSIFFVQEYGAQSFCKALDQPTPEATMQSFAEFMKKFVTAWDSRLINWSYTGTLSTVATGYEGSLGFRQWVYQGCTQIGVFSAAVMQANPNASESLSSPLTDVLPAKYCDVFFGIKTPPAIEQMNAKYYEPLLEPSTSNILFISGSNDPACFPFSISKEKGNATNPNTTAFTVQGGSHCQDLNAPKATDSASLKQARELEVQLATKWTK